MSLKTEPRYCEAELSVLAGALRQGGEGEGLGLMALTFWRMHVSRNHREADTWPRILLGWVA